VNPPKATTFQTYRRLLGYLRPHRERFLFAILCMTVSVAGTLILLNFLQPIMDGIFAKDVLDPTGTYQHLVRWTIPMALLVVVGRSLGAYGQNYMTGYLSQQVVQRIRGQLYERFLRMPMSFFSANRTGSLASRITNDVLILQDSATQVLSNAISSSLSVIGLVGYILYLDWKLSLMALVVFPLAFYPIYRFGKKMRHASGEGQAILAELNSHIHETLGGIRVVKAFGREAGEEEKFNRTNRSYFGVVMRSIRAAALSSPIVEMIFMTAFLLLLIWLAKRVLLQHDLSIGTFTAFAAAASSLYKPLKDLNGVWGRIQNSMAAADRCFDILDTPDDQADALDAVTVEPLREGVEFRNVSFHYLPGKAVLDGVSFSIRKGEIVALVGPSGGGKSTLADLIPRFYRPTAGTILWDGKDLNRIQAASLRKYIGIVTQETILFHGTVRDNIAYARPDADLKDVEAAAKAAFAVGFIQEMEGGYNALVGERGSSLSGGQRQRLAIARALLKDPPLLILDEATSALDNESERLVQKALDELMGHRTTLVIAHRLSTIQRADKILVLEKGRIVEQGKHAELLAKGGLYAHLHSMQFRDLPENGNAE